MYAARPTIRAAIVLAAASAAGFAGTMAPASAAPVPPAGFTGAAVAPEMTLPSAEVLLVAKPVPDTYPTVGTVKPTRALPTTINVPVASFSFEFLTITMLSAVVSTTYWPLDSPFTCAGISCTGGSSTNSFASSSVTSLLKTGAATTTAVGTAGRSVSADVVDRIGALNVLSNVITAQTITAHTNASKVGSGATGLHDTSAFAGLTIKGVAYANANVHPNTVMKVAGLGTVRLHKVIRTSTAITVTMIEIKLDHSIGNLATGSTIAIGYSSTGVLGTY